MKTPMRLVGAALLVVAGYAHFRFVIFPSSAQLSAEQLASLQTLEARLSELVVSRADAATVAAEVQHCVGSSPASPPTIDPAQSKRGDSAWCASSGAFLMSTVAIPTEGSVAYIAREVELHAAPAGRAQSMAQSISGRLRPIDGSAQFIDLQGIGPYSHALKFRAQYPDRVPVLEYYSIHFIESFVDVDITVVLPGAPTNDASATLIAQTLYNRVSQVLAEQAVPTVTP